MKTLLFWLAVIVCCLAIWFGVINALISIAHADVVGDLVPLVIQAESSGNPLASDGQSFGLMGISECVLKDYFHSKSGAEDLSRDNYFMKYVALPSLKEAEFNREVGTWYLRKIQTMLPEKYRNDRKRIISAYNNGIGWLRKHNWNPPKSHKNAIYNAIYQGEL